MRAEGASVRGSAAMSLASLRQQYSGGPTTAASNMRDQVDLPPATDSTMASPDPNSDENDLERMWDDVTAMNREAASQASPWQVAAGQPTLSYDEAWQSMVNASPVHAGPCPVVDGLSAVAASEMQAMIGVARTKLTDDVIHVRLLQSVWRHLAGSADVPHRIGEHWVTVGFQGTDPATDLRGVGLLGLLHLLLLAERAPSQLRSGMLESRHATRHFPFAVASFNFSKMAVDLLLEGKLTGACNSMGGAERPVAALYLATFSRFLRKWEQERLSIEDFGHVLKAISGLAASNPQKLIREVDLSQA